MARAIKMGQITKPLKLVERLAELDDEDTIYVCEPWAEDSDAMAAPEDPKSAARFGIPLEAVEAGMNYFLEVFIAREVVEGWIGSLDEKPTPTAICRRLIEYAIYDA